VLELSLVSAVIAYVADINPSQPDLPRPITPVAYSAGRVTNCGWSPRRPLLSYGLRARWEGWCSGSVFGFARLLVIRVTGAIEVGSGLESSPSRRTILSVAGVLGIAGTAFRGMPASAATAFQTRAASAAASSRIAGFAGANRAAFAAMLGKSPRPTAAPTGVRVYLDAVTYPNVTGYANANWPNLSKDYHSPAHALVSIRPKVEMLLEGKFDADLHAFMKGAPKSSASLLTMWHECATFTLGDAKYPKKPELYREGLSHLQRLAAGEIKGFGPTDVKVGVIDINPGYLHNYNHHESNPAEIYATWMAANLDWYGCDLYDNRTLDLSVYDELSTFRELINRLPGSKPNADWPVNLPECNSRRDPETGDSTRKTTGPTGYRRSDFFHYAWAWLQNTGPGGHLSGLLGFWGGTGGEGSPWPPKDTPTGSLKALVKELSAENAQSSP
jgi:hypothetical protein